MPGPATQEPRAPSRRPPLLACRSQHERDKPGAGAPAQRRARRRRARAASGGRGGEGAVRTQNTPPASRRPAERDARGGPRRGGGRGGSCTCCSMGSRAARCARWEAALARREGAGGRFGRGSKGVLGGGRVVRGPAPRSASRSRRSCRPARSGRRSRASTASWSSDREARRGRGSFTRLLQHKAGATGRPTSRPARAHRCRDGSGGGRARAMGLCFWPLREWSWPRAGRGWAGARSNRAGSRARG